MFRDLRPKNIISKDYASDNLVFVLPAAGRGSGGLADILHLGQSLQGVGRIKVWYLLSKEQKFNEARQAIAWTCPEVKPNHVIEDLDFVPEFLCATAWMTVYRSLGLPAGKKLQFMQDDEQAFYPAGVEKKYICNTFSFGFPTITLGPWLANQLKNSRFAGHTDYIPFPQTENEVQIGGNTRDVIAFYIQPEKRHRGNELLIESARMLAGLPDIKNGRFRIAFFGSNINPYISFDFPCAIHGVLDEASLRKLMDEAVVGVSASFSNISLIPFRFIARGARVVELNMPNVRDNIPDAVRPVFTLAEPSAHAFVDAIESCLKRELSTDCLTEASGVLARDNSWESCGIMFDAFLRGL